MEAHLEQVEAVNPSVNAIVTLAPDQALDHARAADRQLTRGEPCGPLHGLPIAHKDLALTRGMRTTFGSPIFADHVPAEDSLIVERLRSAGAIAYGKTNTPEFGVGSQTFNTVFGATRNPHDLTKTCGGSSGGSAVAVACGMAPIADGSDLGGSLRNPAGFCNVVGFRPTVGRVPMWPAGPKTSDLPTEGPMARDVADTALLLSAMAGPDPRVSGSLAEPGAFFRAPLEVDVRGTRIAWASDFGGLLPVERSVVDTLDANLGTFEDMGCVVNDDLPDFSDADFCFRTIRAWIYAHKCGHLLAKHRTAMKDTVIANTEHGLALTEEDVTRAHVAMAALRERMATFFGRHDFLVLPTAQVPPFDIEQEWVREIEGQALTSYLDWMGACYFVTVTGHPAISVPGGFNANGLPIGIQIVGRINNDLGLLQLAYAFEQATNHGQRHPVLAC